MKTFFLSTLPAFAVGLTHSHAQQRIKKVCDETRQEIDGARAALQAFKKQYVCGPECQETDALAKKMLPECFNVVVTAEKSMYQPKVKVSGKFVPTEAELAQCKLSLKNVQRKVKKWKTSRRLNMNKQRRKVLKKSTGEQKPPAYNFPKVPTHAVKVKPQLAYNFPEVPTHDVKATPAPTPAYNFPKVPTHVVRPANGADQKKFMVRGQGAYKKAAALANALPVAPTGPLPPTWVSTASTKPVNDDHRTMLNARTVVQDLLRGVQNTLRVLQVGKNAIGTEFKTKNGKQADELKSLQRELRIQNIKLEGIDKAFNKSVTAALQDETKAKDILYKQSKEKFKELKNSVQHLKDRVDKLYVDMGRKSKAEIAALVAKADKDEKERDRVAVMDLGNKLTGLVVKLNNENLKKFSPQLNKLAPMELRLMKGYISNIQLKDLKRDMGVLEQQLKAAINKQ